MVHSLQNVFRMQLFQQHVIHLRLTFVMCTTTWLIGLQVTLHQAAIETMFLESISQYNIHVDRPYVPTSIELSNDEAELKNSQTYPVKVGCCA